MNNYYLESEISYINGKKKINKLNLYKNGRIVKTYSENKTNIIINKAMENNFEINVSNNKLRIDDERLINWVLVKDRINKEMRKRKRKIRKFKRMVLNTSIIASLALGGIVLLKNNKNNEPKVVNVYNIYEKSNDDSVNEMDDDFDDIFKFSYEDRTGSEISEIVDNNYSDYINKYSKEYGIDPKLIKSIISQENPTDIKNYSLYAGHGVMQIESVWNNETVNAFNHKTNSYEESQPIDVLRCTDDQEYCIKIACMILSNHYNYIHNNYGFKLSPSQELGATIFSYNKGITAITNALNNTDTYEDFLNYVKVHSKGGDNEYIEHVLSYIEDEDVLTFRTNDGNVNNIMVDNLLVNKNNKTL